MGQALSCRVRHENGLFEAIHSGEKETVVSLLDRDSSLLHKTSSFNRDSALHIAAARGQMEILSLLLERSGNPDALNRQKQTPLMLAAMHGKISCVQKLLEAEANILMFDSLRERTCLHYAAYYGHSECLKAILSAAQSSSISVSWGYGRFVNIRDGKGATPLHLAACQSQTECLNVLLDNGALVCSSTGLYGFPGSSALHLAARGGSLDCVRKLLAWGADRLQPDSAGRIPYAIALKHRHGSLASLLNPSSAEPLVWPSPLKLISELNPEAKTLLEQALMEANKKTSQKTTTTSSSFKKTDDEASEAGGELCSICFEKACEIEVENCGHQMCARCTLALCCYKKPDLTTASPALPICPFCRSGILRLVVAKRKTRSLSNGGGFCSFRRMSGRSSGRIAAEEDWVDELSQSDI